MNTVIVIPARYASTRYPGKPLAQLELPSGETQSLIEMSWRAARDVPGVAGVYVATDDDRIARAASGFGADVIMTDPSCDNGTARVAQAVVRGGLQDADVVVNLQGDAPLTPAWFVSDLVATVQGNTAVQMATPVLRCDPETLAHFREDRAHGRVGGTTAVMNRFNHALYFSKEVLPYVDPGKTVVPMPVFHHVGVYAYRPAALAAYAGWDAGPLETLEGLEQLRFLENGIPIQCVEVQAQGHVFWELNNPEDIPRIEKAIKDTTQ